MLGRRAGLWISNPTKSSRATVEQLVLTEHPIDAMSFYQLRKKEMGEVNTVFASTAGNPGLEQLKAIKELVTLHKVSKVLLANDNDKAGAYYNEVYKKLLAELHTGKKEVRPEVRRWCRCSKISMPTSGRINGWSSGSWKGRTLHSQSSWQLPIR